MIITVTLNPAVDKTLYVPGFKTGRLNRIESMSVEPGGKGINVSLTLKNMDAESTAVGIFGGSTGMSIVDELGIRGIKTEAVYVSGDTRTNTKIVCGNELTELNEAGPEAGETSLERLREVILKYAEPANIFVFSGSVARGIPDDIYYELISMVRERGAVTILDADGELFRKGIEAMPYAVKPNLTELFTYYDEDFGGTIPEDYKPHVVDYAAKLIESGIETVIVSLGADGAYFTNGVNNMFLESEIDDSEVVSSVGAGDSMVAGLAYSLEYMLDFDEMAKLTMKMAAKTCRRERD